jgi:hypothetical protein
LRILKAIKKSELHVRQTTILLIMRFWLLLPLLLYGCASPEVLIPKSGIAPTGVDLSGQWKIYPRSMLKQHHIDEAIDRTDGVNNKRIMRKILDQQRDEQRGILRSAGTSGGLVHVFLKTGKLLKITQTPYALFISFDRAVVLEYRFGENSPVNIGEADAHRVSGWQGDTYVIETLGEKRMKLTDSYSLTDDNNRLIRRITLRSKNMEEFTIIQEFNRESS